MADADGVGDNKTRNRIHEVIMTKCHVCGSEKVTYYRQIRIDGVTVVTARCENDHSPIKGKPFYPVYNFHVDELPLLPSQRSDPVAQQAELFKAQDKEVEQLWKYPASPRPKSNGRNILLPIEDES